MSQIRVLLVDDEQDLLKLLARRLERRDMRVSAVDSGQGCVEAVKAADFDVIILDMRMPGMDGLETLKEVKRISPRTQVIILTGHASSEAAMRGMDLGAFDYMIKPVVIDDLLLKIQDAVRSTQASG